MELSLRTRAMLWLAAFTLCNYVCPAVVSWPVFEPLLTTGLAQLGTGYLFPPGHIRAPLGIRARWICSHRHDVDHRVSSLAAFLATNSVRFLAVPSQLTLLACDVHDRKTQCVAWTAPDNLISRHIFPQWGRGDELSFPTLASV
eukprot:744580-Rhodomonas_salina.1